MKVVEAKKLLETERAITVQEATDKVGISRRIKDYKRTAQELGIGEITRRDIAGELEKPARDPRDEMPRPILRSDILEMKDLEPGMVLKGTVRNVIDFGAFVDIGVHQDGLVHISQMTDKYITFAEVAQAFLVVVDIPLEISGLRLDVLVYGYAFNDRPAETLSLIHISVPYIIFFAYNGYVWSCAAARRKQHCQNKQVQQILIHNS